MAKLVLKASAGTGKTFRLSLEFLLSLLKSPNYKNYENILIMTFTKKATAEIKKEVLDKIGDFSKINELVKENPNDDVLDIIKKSNIEEKLKDKYETLLKVIEKLYKNKITKSDLIKLSKIYEDIIKNKEKLKIYTIDSFLNI
ncbi:MAG: UvrD-helicase domain-containing protein, partial [Fusobacterium sp.]|nr:UvrD-helicase domain-containing protein [Fusobacterium sp.]